MNLGIDKIIKDGNGNALLFTAIAAGAICNTLPTPFDAIYFNRMSQMKRDYEQGIITAEKYEWHLAIEYYVWTTLWYLGIGTVLLLMNKDYKNNVKILFSLIAAGVVIGTVQKNIQKDKELEQLKGKNG